MEIFLAILLVLGVIHLVQAQSQPGFINLDCGLPASEPSPYSESKTGLRFSSDAKFIQSGEIATIQPQTNLRNTLKPYTTLRYFPEGTRNCYNLLVEKGRKYLIKAWFRYGNYDGHDIKPKFDLYIGPNIWTTVDMNLVNISTSEEILHVPTSDSLQICLVKNETTTPFISSLELRPLGNGSYITQLGSLKLFSRRYFTTSDDYIRYPDDAYDRLWNRRSLSGLTHVSTTSDVSNGIYNLPKSVRQNAATLTNASLPLTISWIPENPNDQFYVYLHFAEIQDLQANETREFSVLNGNLFADPEIPKKFEITTIQSKI